MSIPPPVNWPVRLSFLDTWREGLVIDLTPDGATLELEGALQSLEQQPVDLILKAPAGILEIQAVVYDREITS